MNRMLAYGRAALFATGAALFLAGTPAFAIDFGDDASQWSNDAECDDPRFAGPGMTETTLLQADILHDAADCQAAFESGELVLDVSIGFGDDAGTWPEDGECDDPRFEGEGIATALNEDNNGHDATDCRLLFNASKVTLIASSTEPIAAGDVDFGDDTSSWANNGECDDPRFEGAGMAVTLLDADTMHDATDCQQAFEAGRITLLASVPTADVDFGDDTSSWANNGECDDPRFEGPGMAATLLDSDNGHDATDCQQAFDAGRITLVASIALPDVELGDDDGFWALNGECDDPRFAGLGMALKTLDEDILHDA
ncbi:MAG: hypothetical protein WD230_05735, partial [Cucumibacter sp.]